MRIAICAAAMLLSGCVSYGGTMLRNSDGKVMTCSGNWGFGLIGAPVAMAEHSDCIKKANAAGYYEVGTPIPTAVKTDVPAAK